MSEFDETPAELAGVLLAAHPNLVDPNFRRGVVFISAHTEEEGAFGVMVNRATGQQAHEILPGKDLGLLASVPVFMGGPVGADQLIFAAFEWDEIGRRMRWRTHLLIEEAEEAAAGEFASVRAFVGYAGWTQGQLEAELKQRAWLVRPPSEEILDADRCVRLWPEIMRGAGPVYKLLAEAPDDPSLN